LKGMEALRDSPQPAVNKAILERLGVVPSAALRLPLLLPSPDQIERAIEGLNGLLKVPTPV
jgi:dihydrodipicolinate synthase/N-acetylneuraminate lyase